MPRRLTRPDHISEPRGGVVERTDLNARVDRSRNEGVAGTQRRAEDTELAIALLLEPFKAGADVIVRPMLALTA